MKNGGIRHFYSELKRRNVIKSGLAYLAASWILLQVLSIVLPTFGAPEYYLKWALFLLLGVLPFWLLFSWEYEITEDGLKRIKTIHLSESITAQTAKTLDKMIIVALSIAIVLLGYNMYRNSQEVPPEVKSSMAINNSIDRSIAVLAFQDMSPEKDQEYFSDGISEEILNLLAKIPDIKVISRTSSFSFKDKESTAAEIGETLHVSYILEGSVRRSGDKIRITAQLINVADGAHIWSETYDREFDDVFKIQDEIAARVTTQLKSTLVGDTLKSQVTNVDAYNLYLQARDTYIQSSAESNKAAEILINKSIALDSTYAPSWLLLGRIYFQSGLTFGARNAEESLKLAADAMERSIELDPDNALSYLFLAHVQSANWDFENSTSNIKKAFELDPDNVEVLSNSAILGFVNLDKKISNLKRAIAMDPLASSNYFNLGLLSYWNGDLKESEEALETYSLHHPNSAVLHHLRTRVFLAEGRNEEALEEAKKEVDEFFRLYSEALALSAVGKREESDLIIKEIIQKNPNEYANVADIYAFRGDIENAFLYLQKAVEHKDPSLAEVLFYPTFRSLYKDARWKRIQRQMGLPEDNVIPTA